MKHVFIINPTSGVGKYQEVVSWVEKHFEEENFDIHITKYAGHAKEIASRYGEGVVLYAVGGDGTAFEVVNGMNFENEFCVIPVGTGNDFFKMIPYEKSIEELLHETIFESKTEYIDLGQVNEHYFLNCANMGVDADINYRANRYKDRATIPRPMIYIASAIREVFTMKPVYLTINGKDFEIEKDISLLAIMNGRYYGGAFMAAPKAKINDGLLDICIVDGIKPVKAFPLISKYMKGKHENLDIVEFKNVDELDVKSKDVIVYAPDG